MNRGEVWWAELREPAGLAPGSKRPVVIVQSDDFNVSNINTISVAAITSNVCLAGAPGYVSLSKLGTGLKRESVVNVSQVLTLDKSFLSSKVGRLPAEQQRAVDDGLRIVLSL